MASKPETTKPPQKVYKPAFGLKKTELVPTKDKVSRKENKDNVQNSVKSKVALFSKEQPEKLKVKSSQVFFILLIFKFMTIYHVTFRFWSLQFISFILAKYVW